MSTLFYEGDPAFRHGEEPAVGVLMTILGTPAAPTAAAVRPYLRAFLGDPRVIEVARWKWWLILRLFVLPFRPRASARLYASIWTDEGSPEGSPLLAISRRQAAALETALRGSVATPIHVALGATYGEPSVRGALESLRAKGCRRILFLPMFSHYSSTSTGAAFDALVRVLTRWRWVPELRTVQQWHDEPGYIAALAASVREHWAREGRADHLLMSFHGVPQRYLEAGDPYHCQCLVTARLLAEALALPPGSWTAAFQSRFGREAWLKPYTDVTLEAMARGGVRSVDVVCPGFAADCLETLEEIDEQNRRAFLSAGGERFGFVPCLDDRADHVSFLADLALRQLGGWVERAGELDREARARERTASRARAEALRAAPPEADAGYGRRCPASHAGS